MAKTRQSLSARVSQATGRRRKKPTSRTERAFDEVKQLVSETGDRLLSRSSRSKAATKRVSVKKKTTSTRVRSGQQRQAETKKAGATRIRSGQQRQAEAKKAARKRGAKTT